MTRASRGWIPRLSIPRAETLMTVCLEELVSACSVNSARDFNRKANFIPALKHWVFIRQWIKLAYDFEFKTKTGGEGEREL